MYERRLLHRLLRTPASQQRGEVALLQPEETTLVGNSAPPTLSGSLFRFSKSTALPLSPGWRNVRFANFPNCNGHWYSWNWRDFANLFLFNADLCWNDAAAGHGLAQA